MIEFKLHVHRQALHSSDPKKWYVHLDPWGPDPRAFVDVKMNVPTSCVVDPVGCGCAQAWIAGTATKVELSADGNVLTLS